MNATISCDTLDIKQSSARESVADSTPELMGCRRCGGMLVDEHCMDIGEEGSGHRFWGMRCIQCGDVIDETILRNRYSLAQTINKLRSRTRFRPRAQALIGSVGERGAVCQGS